MDGWMKQDAVLTWGVVKVGVEMTMRRKSMKTGNDDVDAYEEDLENKRNYT